MRLRSREGRDGGPGCYPRNTSANFNIHSAAPYDGADGPTHRGPHFTAYHSAHSHGPAHQSAHVGPY